MRGSSARSGTNTVPPPFTVWSRPWSKNWPKKVNSELNGGDSPTSVVTFGMGIVWCAGMQPTGVAGTASVGGSEPCTVAHGTTPLARRLGAHGRARGSDRCRVRGCLVDDEVADEPWLGVVDVAGLAGVGGARAPRIARAEEVVRAALGWPERGRGEAREQLVGGAEGGMVGGGRLRRPCGGRGGVHESDEVVAGSVDGAQAVRRERIGNLVRPRADHREAVVRVRHGIRVRLGSGEEHLRVMFGDLDLLEDEGQIRGRDGEAAADRARCCVDGGDHHAECHSDGHDDGDHPCRRTTLGPP